jgi:putative transposase
MRKKFTDTQIVAAIKKTETGIRAGDVAREYGVSEATIYNWKAKYGGMDVAELQRFKDLEVQHNELKKIAADLLLENSAIKALLSKKF